MTITLSSQEYRELFAEAIKNGDIVYQSNAFETIFEYPKQLAQGYGQRIQLRPGLELSIDDYVNREHLIRKIPECKWPVGLYFHVSGDHICDCAAHVCSGQNSLTGNYVVPPETIEYPAAQRFARVYICTDPQAFEVLVAGQLEQLPSEFKQLIEGADRLTNFLGTTTPSMAIALQQIFNCPYRGLTKRVYLESKILELLALQFSQFVEAAERRSLYKNLRGSDIDCIHNAKEILNQNLDNPPSLLELARRVGLNDRKLKQGFRQVFNTTPFSYLRDYRLEQARQLLMDTETPVEQVANAVGYADRSRFAMAFRKKFGVNPKSYQLQNRKREI